MYVIIVACLHPLNILLLAHCILVHLILVHTTRLVSDSMAHVQECCIHAALASLFFGTVIPTSFNVIFLHFMKRPHIFSISEILKLSHNRLKQHNYI